MSTVTAVAAAEPDPPQRRLPPAEPDWPDDTATTLPPTQAAAILHTIAALLGYGHRCEPTGQPHHRHLPGGGALQLSAFQLHDHDGQPALLLELSDGTQWRLIAEPVQL